MSLHQAIDGFGWAQHEKLVAACDDTHINFRKIAQPPERFVSARFAECSDAQRVHGSTFVHFSLSCFNAGA